MRDAIPIALGYLAVAFTLGIAARNAGVHVLPATIMSLTNTTSAGEFAAITAIAGGVGYAELALMQLVINLRYMLMSCALTQKLDPKFSIIHRFFIGFGVTDEIFGISVARKGKLNTCYMYGAMSIAIPAWTIGTCLGVVLGNVLPGGVVSALSVALYGMFLAIIIPPARDNKVIRGLVIIAMAASFLFTKIPVIKNVSSGMKVIILTVVISGSRMRTQKMRRQIMKHNIYLYILVMAAVTYLIRVLPLTLIKKEIKNKTVRSFLFYVPYVTLAVMTFPAILTASNSMVAAGIGFVVALILAWRRTSMFVVSLVSCAIVYILELFM